MKYAAGGRPFGKDNCLFEIKPNINKKFDKLLVFSENFNI